ncbi:Cytochrome P450 84A4-like protein [Drosera capensis]
MATLPLLRRWLLPSPPPPPPSPARPTGPANPGLASLSGPATPLLLLEYRNMTLSREVLRDNDQIFANRDVPVAARAATYGGFDIAWTPYRPDWRMLRKVHSS